MVEVPAQPPLLADGLFIHHEREPTPIEFETEIRVPNIDCDRCWLQATVGGLGLEAAVPPPPGMP